MGLRGGGARRAGVGAGASGPHTAPAAASRVTLVKSRDLWSLRDLGSGPRFEFCGYSFLTL